MNTPLEPHQYSRLGLTPLSEKQREAFNVYVAKHLPSCPRCGDHTNWEGGIPSAQIADMDFGQGVKAHPTPRTVIFLCRSCNLMPAAPLQADFATVGIRRESMSV